MSWRTQLERASRGLKYVGFTVFWNTRDSCQALRDGISMTIVTLDKFIRLLPSILGITVSALASLVVLPISDRQ